jgi:hypothetical protein
MSYPYIEYFLKLDKKLKNKVSLKEFLKKEWNIFIFRKSYNDIIIIYFKNIIRNH